MKLLPSEYYKHSDVLFLSRDLLGKFLMTRIDGVVTGGMITETEAYRGPEDKASHAFGLRRTKRNEAMYNSGGIAYVYCCYGIHALFNVVTNATDIPHAILIRAIVPEVGIPTILKRRKKKSLDKTTSSGPGTLTQALGISLQHNFAPLTGSTVWIEDRNIQIKEEQISIGPRIGVDYAGEDALLPWRFRFEHDKQDKNNRIDRIIRIGQQDISCPGR